jgi:hypothetical protein
MKIMTCAVAIVAPIVATAMACSSPDTASGFGSGKNGEGDPPPGQFDNGTSQSSPGGAGCVKDPSFYDVPGDDCDNDADGKVDNPPTCDADIASAGTAEDFARAMGICDKASERGYGLVSAKFTRGYGREDLPKAEQHNVLPKFGNVIKPREGRKLGVISTGYAQEFNGAANTPFGGPTGGRAWFGRGGTGSAPPGFPKGAAGCPQESEVNDVVNVRLELKAPRNASGFKFDFNFYSGEWPGYICSNYNDGFIAYLTAKSYNGGKGDNISFDAKKNPVSVNNGFFDRCTQEVTLGCRSGTTNLGRSACPGGPSELGGTGFGIVGDACGRGEQTTLGGATGWLSSNAPVQAGETFTLELMIWDTGDAVLDSSVLLDNFHWLAGAVKISTQRPDDVK